MHDERSFLARHLRVLSLDLMQASADICAEADPILKPTWLSMIGRLAQSPALTVMDAARDTGLSHVHVQNILKSMKAARIVTTKADPGDGRRTFYSLTKKGRDLLPKVALLNTAVLAAVQQIQEETGDDLFAALASFQSALNDRDWKLRVTDRLHNKKDDKV